MADNDPEEDLVDYDEEEVRTGMTMTGCITNVARRDRSGYWILALSGMTRDRT